jgi:hypothetical protein
VRHLDVRQRRIDGEVLQRRELGELIDAVRVDDRS